jgi:hypothetical protein
MSPRHGCALVGLSSLLGACGSLVGIQDLGVDSSSTAPAPDAQAPAPEAGATPNAPAAPPPKINVPSDGGPLVDAATANKRVFLTSTVMTGKLDNHPGVDGADALCTSIAKAALLGNGLWVAWLSGNGKNAIDRLDSTYEGPYVTVGLPPRQIVANKAQLASGHLDGPIDVMEDKQTASSNQPWVWTGTVANGAASATCNDWTDEGFAVGTIGSFDQSTGGRWTDNGGPQPLVPNWCCNTLARLYCFEK